MTRKKEDIVRDFSRNQIQPGEEPSPIRLEQLSYNRQRVLLEVLLDVREAVARMNVERLTTAFTELEGKLGAGLDMGEFEADPETAQRLQQDLELQLEASSKR